MRHDQEMLRGYLVADVEDPRINVQSILTRHFLVEALFGPRRFAALKLAELRFAAALNWLRGFLGEGGNADAALHALRVGADNAEGTEIPRHLRLTFGGLPTRANGGWVPHYIRKALESAQTETGKPSLTEPVLSTFQALWRRRLDKEHPARLAGFEPACGSANDYRFIEAFGIARLIDYTGMDLCEKNVLNAKALFPHARFAVGNAFNIDAGDQAFDCCIVHDLFEHLSPAGMEAAIGEICRVSRRGVCAGFFNMDEIDEHQVRTVDDYHWNTLSMERTKALFERHFPAVQVIHIESFLRWRLGCGETHNPRAYTLVAGPKQ